MSTLSNKVALVTGGSSGIGAATVKRLAAEGANVFFTYHHDEAGAQQVREEVKQKGGEAYYGRANIGSVSDIRHLFRAATSQYGPLDIAVLNAGYGLLKPIAECTEEDFDNIFSVNTKGTFFSLQEAYANMNDNGSIVLVSSSTTHHTLAGVALYAGSKAPFKLFAEVAALEFGKRGINVNAVMPGVTLTRMAKGLPDAYKQSVAATSPFNRLGESEDLANFIYTLVSADGHWVTGQTILANGGNTQ